MAASPSGWYCGAQRSARRGSDVPVADPSSSIDVSTRDDVDQHPRSEAQLAPGGIVPSERHLVGRPAGHVVPGALAQQPLREGFEVADATTSSGSEVGPLAVCTSGASAGRGSGRSQPSRGSISAWTCSCATSDVCCPCARPPTRSSRGPAIVVRTAWSPGSAASATSPAPDRDLPSWTPRAGWSCRGSSTRTRTWSGRARGARSSSRGWRGTPYDGGGITHDGGRDPRGVRRRAVRAGGRRAADG